MKSHQLLRCIFPDVLADYFDVVDIQESVSQFDFWLDERNFMEKSDHKLGTVSSYGFTSERIIQDFPLRGKAVYLHVRRRKWRDSSNGEIFTYSYDDLTAEGSKRLMAHIPREIVFCPININNNVHGHTFNPFDIYVTRNSLPWINRCLF